MSKNIKFVKICGIKFPQKINYFELLKPFFIGFIFYTYSHRFIGAILPVETLIKKVSVFVNNSIENIIKIKQKYAIDFVQLHGNENIKFSEELYKNNISIIKVYRVNETFIFYKNKYINYSLFFFYLFDTHCLNYGGSGKKFSWEKIIESPFKIPYFLSGGISTEDVNKIKNIFNPKYLGIDLNSKFEIEPINKNMDELRRFIYKISL